MFNVDNLDKTVGLCYVDDADNTEFEVDDLPNTFGVDDLGNTLLMWMI